MKFVETEVTVIILKIFSCAKLVLRSLFRILGMLFQIVEHVLFFQKLYETNEIDVRKLVRKIQIFLTVVDECRRVAVNVSLLTLP